jgi:hypothetical protein
MKTQRVQIVARIAPDVRREMTRAVNKKRAKNLNDLIETALRRYLSGLARSAPERAVIGPRETKGK